MIAASTLHFWQMHLYGTHEHWKPHGNTDFQRPSRRSHAVKKVEDKLIVGNVISQMEVDAYVETSMEAEPEMIAGKAMVEEAQLAA